jgi:hypothetical protein
MPQQLAVSSTEPEGFRFQTRVNPKYINSSSKFCRKLNILIPESEISNLGAAPDVQGVRTNSSEHSIQTGRNVTLQRGSWMAMHGSCSSTTTHTMTQRLRTLREATTHSLAGMILPSWHKNCHPQLWRCDNWQGAVVEENRSCWFKSGFEFYALTNDHHWTDAATPICQETLWRNDLLVQTSENTQILHIFLA